jgi:hypothetical protein
LRCSFPRPSRTQTRDESTSPDQRTPIFYSGL